MAYVKLFNSILRSTIWQEPLHIKVVWITMLALSDKDGDVISSIPGLASAAGVTIPQVKEALDSFLGPDEYSSTKDFEGRRIEVIGGGWHLLNHGKYRALLSAEERREYNRQKQADRRRRIAEASKSVNDNQLQSAMSAHTDADAKAEADTFKTKDRRVKDVVYSEEFEGFWKAYPRKTAKGAAWNAWKKTARPDTDALLKAIEAQSKTDQWTKEGGQYIPHPATWLNQRRWEDELLQSFTSPADEQPGEAFKRRMGLQ